MAERKTDTVPIDGFKLKMCIFDHGFTVTELSEKIGFSYTYLSRFTSGKATDMPRRTSALLENFGIH